MRVVILGAGKTGAYVAQVVSEKHDVVLLDRDAKALEEIRRDKEVATLQIEEINGALFQSLLEQKPDLFFAATGEDATNLLACSLAKNVGFPKTVARLTSRDLLFHRSVDVGRLFFVDDCIGAENVVAQEVFNAIVHPGDVSVEHFAHGAIQVRTLVLPDSWEVTKPLGELSFPSSVKIGLIRRAKEGAEEVIIPHGEDCLLPGDKITVIGESVGMHRLSEVFPFVERKVRSVALVGGTLFMVYLAELLLHQKIRVRILDSSLSVCEKIAQMLPEAVVLHRDGRDREFWQSERVESIDVVVAGTGQDGTNVLVAGLAKSLGCPKAFALVSDDSVVPLLEKLDVTPSFTARVNVANRILSILHEESVVSISSLPSDRAKIVELRLQGASPLLEKPLGELKEKLPSKVLIAMVESHGRVSVGKGDTVLHSGDTIVVICAPEEIAQMAALVHG